MKYENSSERAVSIWSARIANELINISALSRVRVTTERNQKKKPNDEEQ